MILLTGNIKPSLCTFHVTPSKQNNSNPLLASVLLSHMCVTSVSANRHARKHTFQVHDMKILIPVVSIFNVCYDAKLVCLHPIPIPVDGCKSLQKSEFPEMAQVEMNNKINFDHGLDLLSVSSKVDLNIHGYYSVSKESKTEDLFTGLSK